MMRFEYPATVLPAAKFAPRDRGYIVSFPDVPEAHTQAETARAALARSADALMAALGGYMELRRPLPTPSRPKRGQPVIAVPPLAAAKLALYRAMQEARVSRVALGKRLGMSEAAVRRMLDLDHRSHIGQIDAALAALGKRLFLEVADAA